MCRFIKCYIKKYLTYNLFLISQTCQSKKAKIISYIIECKPLLGNYFKSHCIKTSLLYPFPNSRFLHLVDLRSRQT